MRTDFAEFDEALLESSKDRNWLLVGLMISLAIHGALCGYFYKASFLPPRNALEERVQTPTFKVTKVDMNALDKASQDQLNPAAKPEADKTDVQLPDDQKSFDQLLEDVHASATLPDDTQNVLPDKPQVDSNANSVMKEIEATTIGPKGLKVTASIGVACLLDHATDAATLVEEADRAMYEAKNLGRNCVRVSGEPRPTGYYMWEFREDGGKRVLTVRKGEGEPFTASVGTVFNPGDITVFRGY